MSQDSLDQKGILGQPALLYCTLHHYRQAAIAFEKVPRSLCRCKRGKRVMRKDRQRRRRLLFTAVEALYFVVNETIDCTLLERKYVNECHCRVITA